MFLRILKVYFIYGTLLLITTLVTELFFYFLFGEHLLKTISAVIFGVIFAWIVGYKGVKAIMRIRDYEKFGSPSTHGITIVLVQSILASLITYVMLKQIIILEGIIYILAGGHGGKLAYNVVQANKPITISRPIKLLLGIIFGLFALFVIFLVGKSSSYRIFDIKIEQQDQNVLYVDRKFGYSFVYPKTWKRINYPFSPGSANIVSDKDPQTSIGFQKYRGTVTNLEELRTMTENDIKYGEGTGVTTESIEKVELYGKKVILWKFKKQENSKDVFFNQYYIADYKVQNRDNVVLVWIATENKKEPNEKEVVNNILSSFKLIP